MAELYCKIGTTNTYEDGDILAAFNDHRIQGVHAEHICHIDNAGGGVNVHRSADTLAEDLLSITSQYKFERISITEVRRTDLTTRDEEIFDDTPRVVDGKNQQMDVRQFVERRLKHHRHSMFGTAGAERWYGGRRDISQAKVDLVWTAIEAKSANLQSDATLWPAGIQDLKEHLALRVDDFDDATSNSIVVPDEEQTGVDKNGDPIIVTHSKRLNSVDWRNISELSADTKESADDKGISVDGRDSDPLVIENIVNTKVRS